jgi:glycosyltransferase involved in cell wall biosynthesis
MPSLSLIVPLFNEQANVRNLVERVLHSGLPESGLAELILVENGSRDDTRRIVRELAASHSLIKPTYLDSNEGYGGGVYRGLRAATSDVVGYMPGDLQVTPEDVLKVWRASQELMRGGVARYLAKGVRTQRHDGLQTIIPSYVYTALGNAMLGLRVRDINGLPKLFTRELVDRIPERRMQSFTFDAQLLALACHDGYELREVSVCFHARRQGVSSWGAKRIRTYAQAVKDLMLLRRAQRSR